MGVLYNWKTTATNEFPVPCHRSNEVGKESYPTFLSKSA